MKSEAERFHEYADRITHETAKFNFASRERLKAATDSKKWLRQQQAASKRFVLKMIRIVEAFW
jgi:hypothetical protein